jgi:hypothetical protein
MLISIYSNKIRHNFLRKKTQKKQAKLFWIFWNFENITSSYCNFYERRGIIYLFCEIFVLIILIFCLFLSIVFCTVHKNSLNLILMCLLLYYFDILFTIFWVYYLMPILTFLKLCCSFSFLFLSLLNVDFLHLKIFNICMNTPTGAECYNSFQCFLFISYLKFDQLIN